jgi:hypothetical protein
MYFGYSCSFQLFDKGIIELFGPLGFGWQFYSLSKNFSRANSGVLYHYSFAMMLSTIFFILFFLLSFYNFVGSLNFFILLFCYSLVTLNVNKN